MATLERDEIERQAFGERRRMAKTVGQLVYVDEAGSDNREEHPYGYCEIGQRFHALKSGKRTQRVSTDCGTQARVTFCSHDIYWLV